MLQTYTSEGATFDKARIKTLLSENYAVKFSTFSPYDSDKWTVTIKVAGDRLFKLALFVYLFRIE